MTVPLWYKREINLGDYGPDVRTIQRILGLEITGIYDKTTMALVMGLSTVKKVATTGEVNAVVAEKTIGPASDESLVPEWFHRELRHFDMGVDVQALNSLLGLDPGDDRFREETEAAVRRLESSIGRRVSGVVDEELAKILGPAE